MSSTSYTDAYAAFLTGGFGAKSEVLPDGSYPIRIALVKGDQAQGKSFRVGVRVVVLDGHPLAGKSTWLNQTLTLPKPGDDRSTTAFMMFLKFMVALGGDVVNEAIKQGTPPEKLHELIVVGTEGSMQLKGDRPYNGKMQQDFVAFDATAIPSPMGGMVAVGTAQPAPAAPVAAPAPVAVAVPVAAPVVAPAAAQAVLSDALVSVPDTAVDLQAQLLALQAQLAAQAPAPVPAAAAPAAGPSF